MPAETIVSAALKQAFLLLFRVKNNLSADLFIVCDAPPPANSKGTER